MPSDAIPADAVPAPGSLSVPPLDGWHGIVVALVVVVVVAVLFLGLLALGAMRAGRSGSPEWQAWLDARSRSRQDRPGPSPEHAD